MKVWKPTYGREESGNIGRGCFTVTGPSELHEVSLGSFQITNAILRTVHKDDHNLSHYRQG